MSSAIKTTTNFFGSRTFQHIGSTTSSLLGMYGLNKQYGAYNNYIESNAGQINQQYKSYINNSYSDLTTLGLQYNEQYGALVEKGLQYQGKSLSYWGNSGVEVFGSAVQNLSHNAQMIDRYKSDLYSNYINKYNNITQSMNNKYQETVTRDKSLRDRLSNANTKYKWNMANDFIKLF